MASMVSITDSVIEHYSDRDLDDEILMCAVVLHDLGKVKALTPTGSKTPRGEREGHIAIALDWISQFIDGDPERISHLRHLVLSHHGRKEWGSPVEPKTPEAAILHTIDLMDSRVDKLDE
jgi:3'-5' exoribonuclease